MKVKHKYLGIPKARTLAALFFLKKGGSYIWRYPQFILVSLCQSAHAFKYFNKERALLEKNQQ
jgi:hypothetical protein